MGSVMGLWCEHGTFPLPAEVREQRYQENTQGWTAGGRSW
jgi:hypothetical protein